MEYALSMARWIVAIAAMFLGLTVGAVDFAASIINRVAR